MKNLFGFKYNGITWTWFDIIWPWIGLAAAIIILALLFATNILRLNTQVSIWRDSVWLSWLALPIYMIHEFEEYGVDFLGDKHAFPNGLCQNLRLGNYPTCSIPHEFYLYVNIPLVWFFAVLAATFSFKNLFVGLGLYGVIISNGIVHTLTFFWNKNIIQAYLLLSLFFCHHFFGWVKPVLERKDSLKKASLFWLVSE